ncbi:MAG: lysostaphin resistance A-like protein [Solirubrobacteraceae bacterium]
MTARTRVGARGRAWLGAPAVLLSVAVLIASEAALLAPGHTLAADIVSAVLVFILLNGALIVTRSQRSTETFVTARALQALALVALARVVGFGLPLHDASAAAATLVVAALIGLAAAWAAPSLGVSLSRLMAFRPSADQTGAAVAGLVLGVAAYVVGAPTLWERGAGGSRIVVALVAVAAASVTEELLFRGLVQSTLQRSLGRAGLLAATALFASTYLDLGTAALVMVVALAGLVFSVVVARTGNLTGAVAGHALFALGAGAFWPVLLGRRHHAWVHGPGVTVVVGLALAAMTVIALRTTVD